MKHCIECGAKLSEKQHPEEGVIPYCLACEAYRFPIFNTAVSLIILDEQEEKTLFIEQYGREGFILVAGYISKGESAEQTAAREVKEEVGLAIENIRFNKSEYFESSNTLMLNFSCRAKNSVELVTNFEVDRAQWFKLEDAVEGIRPNSLAKRFFMHWLDSKQP
ncbi:NAD(+) diphosphatase [Reinekea thalattae]|uniref:NAD(+) diphosphatase n=1 Tax=Reinekea thalattae TaxID=2593301 RepID=A0A5C8YZN7_9GAMM|nr:NUDIX domain-containing protein [Reinekea thalattae]TXR51342.1 NUDIX domain-containing protein [Reinekea thalattae]